MTTELKQTTTTTDSETVLPCDSYEYESGRPAPTDAEVAAARQVLADAGLSTKQSKVTRRFSDLHLYGGVCAMVHALCRENPTMRRCDLVRLCESKGIATNTAKTQVQKFMKAHRSVEATEASDA